MPSASSWHMLSTIMCICRLTILPLVSEFYPTTGGLALTLLGWILSPFLNPWFMSRSAQCFHDCTCTQHRRLVFFGCHSTLSWSSSKWELRVSRVGLPRWEIYPLQMDMWQGMLSEAIVILPGTFSLFFSHSVQMHCKLIGALLEPVDRVFDLAHLHICESPLRIANIIPIHLHSLLVAYFNTINSINYLLCKVESSLS